MFFPTVHDLKLYHLGKIKVNAELLNSIEKDVIAPYPRM